MKKLISFLVILVLLLVVAAGVFAYRDGMLDGILPARWAAHPTTAEGTDLASAFQQDQAAMRRSPEALEAGDQSEGREKSSTSSTVARPTTKAEPAPAMQVQSMAGPGTRPGQARASEKTGLGASGPAAPQSKDDDKTGGEAAKEKGGFLGWLTDLFSSKKKGAAEGDLAPAKDEKTDAELSGGLLLDNEEAPYLRPGEVIRRWPSKSVLKTDLSGNAPKLADFKGRAYEDQPLKGAIIFLDYGHGGVDGGTAYPSTPPHDYVEKELNLEIGKIVREKLEALGATVVTMRDGDEWFSIYCRSAKTGEYLVNLAKQNMLQKDPSADTSMLDAFMPHFRSIYDMNMDAGGGDMLGGMGQQQYTRLLYDIERQFENAIYISLHCNFNEMSNTVGGLQVYYLDNEAAYDEARMNVGMGQLIDSSHTIYPVYQNYSDEGRTRLAQCVYDGLTGEVPELQTREAPSLLTGNYAVLRCTGLDSVLIEMGFLSNSDDRLILGDPDRQVDVAEGITRSIYDYYCQ